MFKLLFIGGLLYYAYRFIISPPELDDQYGNNGSSGQNNKPDENDDYVDYEELD